MRQFGLVFNSTWGREMTDGHLWFSLVWRPTFSTFTRVQRLSCCLALLFSSMIANAMFYGRLEETEKGLVLQLGPISISPQMIYIATISTLIVFPVNFIIVLIFRKTSTWEAWESRKSVETRPSKVSPDLGNNSYLRMEKLFRENMEFLNVQSGRSTDVYPNDTKFNPWVDPSPPATLPKPKKKKACMLPPWSVVFAYLLVLGCVGASGFFTVLYSLEWGKEKSEAWLIAMFVSLFQSVCVIQPVKVRGYCFKASYNR